MLLALDDTDGPAGGCTTHVGSRILRALPDDARAGLPRLVRLHPDNPYKTRGNAAVVLDLADDLDAELVLDTAEQVVREHARVADGKGAGLALFQDPPAEAWYTRGVTERVGLDEARRTLADVPTRTLGNGRGLVGCLCAAAWRPDPGSTYTRIAYRTPDRWGTPRRIDEAAARRLETDADTVFDAYDPASEHAVVAPRTPCPVLLGLRATEPDDLASQVDELAREPVAHARTFVTNQASDDHLVDATCVPLTAQAQPTILEGGHVRLSTRTPRGRERTVMAFEPTGRLRTGLRDVEPGDGLLALGSLKDEGRQVNAEKVLHVPAHRIQAPACPGCGTQMSSVGRRGGYRCRACGARGPGEPGKTEPCWHEADASARRHLARPLALGLAEQVEEAVARLVDREPVLEDPLRAG